MEEDRLEQILDKVRWLPFSGPLYNFLPSVVSNVLSKSTPSNIADQSLINSLERFLRFKGIPVERIEDSLSKEYEFISYLTHNHKIPEDETYEPISMDSALAPLIEQIKHWREKESFSNQEQKIASWHGLKEIIASFPYFTEDTVYNLNQFKSNLQANCKKYRDILLSLEDLDACATFEEIFRDSVKRNRENAESMLQQYQEKVQNICTFHKSLRSSLLRADSAYFSFDKTDREEFLKAITALEPRILGIHPLLYESIMSNIKEVIRTVSRGLITDRTFAAERVLETAGSLSDWMNEWDLGPELGTEETRNRIERLYFDYVSRDERKLERFHHIPSRDPFERLRPRQKRDIVKIVREDLFTYSPVQFFCELLDFFVDNFSPKEDTYQDLEKIHEEPVCQFLLNYHLKNRGHTDFSRRFDILTRLARMDLPEKDKFSLGMEISVNDEDHNKRLLNAISHFNDPNLIKRVAALKLPYDVSITNFLGSGASGAVYLAQHGGLGSPVALKIKENVHYDEKEAKILKSLDHPNIVRVFSAEQVEDDNQCKLVIMMEYVPGKTLKELIKENPSGFNLEDAVKYGSQLLDAVGYLRKKGKFHRDLNPSNVKITPDGQMKVYDFGFSEESLSAPPHGNRRYGGENDIFSWGIMLCEIVSGKHLVYDREPSMGSNTFAERIRILKESLRDDNGQLNEVYRKRVQDLVPQELQEPIILALENTKDIDTNARFSKVEEAYSNLLVDPSKKAEAEALLGRDISRKEYLTLSKLFKK